MPKSGSRLRLSEASTKARGASNPVAAAILKISASTLSSSAIRMNSGSGSFAV